MATTPSRRRADHLHLVPGGFVLPAEEPSDHIRNALQLLILAERRVAELTIPPDAALVDLLKGAEARLFHAAFELEGNAP